MGDLYDAMDPKLRDQIVGRYMAMVITWNHYASARAEWEADLLVAVEAGHKREEVEAMAEREREIIYGVAMDRQRRGIGGDERVRPGRPRKAKP